ncbi:MAG: DUF1553 domain-containing protein [Planctomycetes bacterium]|nr:DUF1553 domain-containing protein [Planctomycetota bacterium]
MRNTRQVLLGAALLAAGSVFGVLGTLHTPAGAQANPDKSTTAALPEREVTANIDREIAKVWERDKLTPAGVSSDEEFIRRVYFDTIGLPPTPAEVRAFLADNEKEKRRNLVSTLVSDKRFSEHMADQWTNIIVGRAGRDYGGANHLFAIWFAERVSAGDNFNDIIYDLVTASGQLSENPAIAPYIRSIPAKVPDLAGNLTRNLTGVQIQCAQCHDHPYEEAWTEDVFTGVASFFAPVSVNLNIRTLPVDPSVGDQARPVRLPPRGMEELPADARNRIEEQQKYNKPVTLDGKPLKTDDRSLWRPAMAKWMIAKDNKQTARYIVNRFWSFAFGSGLLNPVDDFNSFNEASHPQLLDWLAQDLIDNDYDFRRLYRAILNSRTYQLSSTGAHPKAEAWHFASAAVRQLSAEQFFGAFVRISGGDDMARSYRARNVSPGEQLKRATERRMKQANESNDPNQRDVGYSQESLDRFVAWYDKLDDGWYMRRTMAQGFARLSSDDEMTEAEGFSLTIDQALAVMNSELTQSLTGSGRGSIIQGLQRDFKDDTARLDELFLKIVGRFPTSAERGTMLGYLKDQKGSTAAWEDIVFALLAGTEFATNH